MFAAIEQPSQVPYILTFSPGLGLVPVETARARHEILKIVMINDFKRCMIAVLDSIGGGSLYLVLDVEG